MSAQSDNKMEDNNQQVAESKGKGKAPEAETMQESMDEDSSDESGVEDQPMEEEEPDEDNMDQIDAANVIGTRTRGKNIDFAKANQELGEDDEEEDDEDFVDPEDDDQMKD